MATLSTLRTEVSAVLGLDTTSAAELALIDQWLNEGVTDLVMRTECYTLPSTMSVSSANSTLPDLISIVEMYVTIGSSNYAMQRVSPAELLAYRRADNTSSTSPIRLYAVDGANLLMVYPTPSATQTINMIYIPRPATMSATSDSPTEIPSEWHKLVMFYALDRGADYDDDTTSEQGDRYRTRYEQGLAEMRKVIHRKGGHRLPRARVNRRRRDLMPHDNSQDL